MLGLGVDSVWEKDFGKDDIIKHYENKMSIHKMMEH